LLLTVDTKGFKSKQVSKSGKSPMCVTGREMEFVFRGGPLHDSLIFCASVVLFRDAVGMPLRKMKSQLAALLGVERRQIDGIYCLTDRDFGAQSPSEYVWAPARLKGELIGDWEKRLPPKRERVHA
jgi:hypothetical protein